MGYLYLFWCPACFYFYANKMMTGTCRLSIDMPLAAAWARAADIDPFVGFRQLRNAGLNMRAGKSCTGLQQITSLQMI